MIANPINTEFGLLHNDSPVFLSIEVSNPAPSTSIISFKSAPLIQKEDDFTINLGTGEELNLKQMVVNTFVIDLPEEETNILYVKYKLKQGDKNIRNWESDILKVEDGEVGIFQFSVSFYFKKK